VKKLFFTLFLLLTISPFLFAQNIIDAIEAKNYKAVEQFVKEGKNVNAPIENGQFPLWNAIWNNDTEMVKLLLKNGADPKQKYKNKDENVGLLEITAQEGLLKITQLLVEKGADIHERSQQGFTPLRIASRNGRADIVKYFISKGSEVDTRGNDGATPLEHAASKGHLEIVKILVQNGADVNIQDKEGDSPLGEAAKHGFVDVVKYLLSKGAKTDLKNDEGNTPEVLARLSGQAKVAEILKNHKKY
jgi:ankyrin repeat protein